MTSVADAELSRVRHSGILNPNVSKLEGYLRRNGFDNFSVDIGMLPEHLIDTVVSRLESIDEEVAQTRSETRKLNEVLRKKLEENETLREHKCREQSRLHALIAKYDVTHEEQRAEMMRQQDVLAKRKHMALELQRKTERLRCEEKRLELELARYQKLCKQR